MSREVLIISCEYQSVLVVGNDNMYYGFWMWMYINSRNFQLEL